MNAALAARLATESDVLLFDVFGRPEQLHRQRRGARLRQRHRRLRRGANCDPSTYLFWDGIHPTSAGHAVIAQAMLDQTGLVTAVPEPETYALMLAGLAAVGVYSRRRSAHARCVAAAGPPRRPGRFATARVAVPDGPRPRGLD